MQIDVQWFISALVEGELLELADAVQLNDEMGDPDLQTYAQTILESVGSQYSGADADEVFNRIQAAADYAVEQAATGNIPPVFAEKAPEETEEKPAETQEKTEEKDKLFFGEKEITPLDTEEFTAAAGTDEFHHTSTIKEEPIKKLAGPAGGFPKTLPKVPPKPAPKPAEAPSEQEENSTDEMPGLASMHFPDEGMAYGELDISPYVDENGAYNGPRTELGLPSLAGADEMPTAQIAAIMRTMLVELRTYGASDFHISAMAKPFIRRNLEMERIEDTVISMETSLRCNLCMLTAEQAKRFQKDQDMNFALEIGADRFRTALIVHKDGIAGSYRLVPTEIPSLKELGFLPKDVETLERLMDYPNGLVLITGPIGSGKTTTLASLVDIANSRREDHIIMVEDPIEILQHSKSCQITQRQVVTHTKSYSSALKGALREDPDIIVIGEMHDLETIENAITAAETGHLVIGTLHTRDAANTMNRILDVFPPNQQPQIRSMTAGSLRGVVCQRLVKGADGKLTIVYEILINTLAVANVINEGKIFQLRGNMQIGSKVGMCTIDQNLLEKWRAGAITLETAREGMTDKSCIDILQKENAVREAQKLAAAMPKPEKK